MVAPDGERIGYAEQGGGVRARSWKAHAPEERVPQDMMPTRARAIAALVGRHRERTPATDTAAPDLPFPSACRHDTTPSPSLLAYLGR